MSTRLDETTLVDAAVMQMAMQLPRARRLQQHVADALAQGKTVVWALPPDRDARGLVRAVREYLRKRGFGIPILDVTGRDGAPLTMLREIVDAEMTAYVGDDEDGCEVAQADSRKGHSDPYEEMQNRSASVMVLRGIETHRERWFDDWVRVINRWADTSRARSARGVQPVGLLVPMTDARLMDKIEDDVFLIKAWYAGDIGEAEMQFLVGEMLENRPPSSDVDRRWIEASYVSLSGSDPSLFAWLVRHCHHDKGESEIDNILVKYARARGWIALLETMDDFPEGWAVGGMLRAFSEDGSPNPESLASPDFWWHGIVMSDAINGTYVHSSALAYRGKTHIVKHRVWRGHARMLLPIFDAVRLDMCRYLGAAFPGWEKVLRPAPSMSGLTLSSDETALTGSDLHHRGVSVGHAFPVTGSLAMARVAGDDMLSTAMMDEHVGEFGHADASIVGETDTADGMEVISYGDVFLTEFPGLLHALRSFVQPQRGYEAVGSAIRSVDYLRKARNDLAHYMPLSRRNFNRVWHEIDRLYEWMV